MRSVAQIIASSTAAFGTSGVRGLVEQIDDATAFAYTQAFLDHLKHTHRLSQQCRIWIGHDRRPSSPAIAGACIAAARHAGHDVVYCGEISTPALAFSALQNSEPAIVITGSHIPFDRNGIKFYRPDGEMMKSDEEPVVKNATEFPDDRFSGRALLVRDKLPDVDPTAQQAYDMRAFGAFEGLLKGMRIGHFQHSAAGRDALSGLLKRLGGEVIPFGRSDKFIPIDTEAVAEKDRLQAQQWCSKYGLDALISTDGDGDRPLLSDETGNYFRGDTLGILAASALQAQTVVTPVSSNSAVERINRFAKVIRTKIGSPHVIESMSSAKLSVNRVVGYEANGGLMTATRLSSPWNGSDIAALPTRDAVLPVLATITLARKSRQKLSSLYDLLPARFTASDRIENMPTDTSLKFIKHLQINRDSAVLLSEHGAPVRLINEIDGLRFTFSDGEIVHLRPSGNAPELRIYVETDSEERSSHLLAHARQATLRELEKW